MSILLVIIIYIIFNTCFLVKKKFKIKKMKKKKKKKSKKSKINNTTLNDVIIFHSIKMDSEFASLYVPSRMLSILKRGSFPSARTNIICQSCSSKSFFAYV